MLYELQSIRDCFKGEKNIRKENLDMSSKHKTPRMVGSGSCFGVTGDLSQHQETQQFAWKMLTKSQSRQEGSLLKTNL